MATNREKITEFATKIGFSMRVHYSAGNGEKLHQVKTRRNNLAHGNISFSECGRDFTLEELVNITINKHVTNFCFWITVLIFNFYLN